jgi:hypothetical protein
MAPISIPTRSVIPKCGTCGFPIAASKSSTTTTAARPSASNGFPPISASIVLYLYVAPAAAALFGYSPATAITRAAFAKERSIYRKSKTPPLVNALQPQNSASNLVAIPITENHCHEKPNGSTKSATNAYAIKSTHSKPKPSKHASAKKSTFAPSATTSPRPPISPASIQISLLIFGL